MPQASGWLGLRPGGLGLRSGRLGLRPGWMAQRGSVMNGQTDGRSAHSTGLRPLSEPWAKTSIQSDPAITDPPVMEICL